MCSQSIWISLRASEIIWFPPLALRQWKICSRTQVREQWTKWWAAPTTCHTRWVATEKHSASFLLSSLDQLWDWNPCPWLSILRCSCAPCRTSPLSHWTGACHWLSSPKICFGGVWEELLTGQPGWCQPIRRSAIAKLQRNFFVFETWWHCMAKFMTIWVVDWIRKRWRAGFAKFKKVSLGEMRTWWTSWITVRSLSVSACCYLSSRQPRVICKVLKRRRRNVWRSKDKKSLMRNGNSSRPLWSRTMMRWRKWNQLLLLSGNFFMPSRSSIERSSFLLPIQLAWATRRDQDQTVAGY